MGDIVSLAILACKDLIYLIKSIRFKHR